MIKRPLVLLALLGLCSTAIAQIWDEKPDYQQLLKSIGDPNQKYVNILDERVLTFDFTEKKELFEDVMYHQQYYLNSPEAIDGLNKIYIPLSATSELLDYNARVISPKGEVRVLSKDELKEATNEGGQTVKFFALSGVELGGVVEFYYKIRREPMITGSVLVLQKKAPTVQSIFRIVSPANFVFKTLSLNGYPEMKPDTANHNEEINVLKAEMHNMPGIKDEKFSNTDAYTMGVLFQLNENRYTGARNIYNYGNASQYIFTALNEEQPKSVAKGLQKILKASNYETAPSSREKIFRIEDYVKRNFFFVEEGMGGEGLSDLEKILEKKQLNDNGAAKLLYQLYKLAGVEIEIVLSCDRAGLRFDPTFESYVFLDDYLFYFPELKDYLMPSARYLRLGLIPTGSLGNNGLFIKRVSLGGIETGAGEVRPIAAYPAEHTGNNMKVEVGFNESVDMAQIKARVAYSGYYAAVYQPAYTYVEESKIKELNNDIVSGIYANAEGENIVVENPGVENLMLKPFIISFQTSSSEFVEKAGNKVLFKVGELIGPQAEMYAEGERMFPVDNDFNRLYTRELIVNIPAGYRCKNPEILAMNVTPFKAAKDQAGFISVYKQEGNKITVSISEYYHELILPKEDYENYRKVINAAADFNKLVLVFEKE